MSEIIIPKTTFEVAKDTFLGYTQDPQRFLRTVAVSLEDENPVFLDGSLRGAVNFSIAGYPDDAQQLLAGSFYRYECTAREIKRQGGRIPFIGKETIRRSFSEVAMLTEGLHRAGGDTEAALRQRVMRIERDDPEVGNIVKQLPHNVMGAFIEGAHSTHLNFVFLDKSKSELTSPVSEPTEPSILPLVRRSIVRSALLETILDQENFVIQALTEAEKYIPRIVNQVVSTAAGAQDYSDVYLLFAGFTINGIMQEFSQRGEKFPTIKGGDSHTHPDPAVNKAMEEDSEEAGELIRKYNLSILDEIKNANPHLDWGIDALLQPLTKMSYPEIIIALNGIVNPYSSLKASLSK